MTTLSAVIAIAIGVIMATWWVVALRGGRVPELSTRPAESRLHLAAEFSTAAMLVLGGVATLARPDGPLLLLFGMGMLAYTATVSAGYFIDRRERSLVVVFGTILVIAVASGVGLILEFVG